jgi:tetratricopeptide (TPR) repeat protein
MIRENLTLLFGFYLHPIRAISETIDRGNWLFGALAVVVVSALLEFGIAGSLYRTYESPPAAPHHTVGKPPQQSPSQAVEEEEEEAPARAPLPLVGQYAWYAVSFSTTSVLAGVLVLGLLYVPFALFLINLMEDLGSVSVILHRDYGTLLTCTLMSWAAANLPFALAGVAINAARPNPLLMLALWAVAKLCFGGLMVVAVQTVFGARLGPSLATVALAWTAFIFESVLGWLASPFILFLGYYYFRDSVGDLFTVFRTRQSYRRYLEAATLNPRDSEAHCQLGLIHMQRHQYSEAIKSFQRAVEIDPREADAHFQWGRIARLQGRFDEALAHFQTVAEIDKQHAQNEIWREIGEAYVAAGRYPDARPPLEHYVQKRPFDPEGLYLLGLTLLKTGETAMAREMFERCVEAERTNPYSHRTHLRKWRRQAEKQLRSLRSIPAA